MRLRGEAAAGLRARCVRPDGPRIALMRDGAWGHARHGPIVARGAACREAEGRRAAHSGPSAIREKIVRMTYAVYAHDVK